MGRFELPALDPAVERLDPIDDHGSRSRSRFYPFEAANGTRGFQEWVVAFPAKPSARHSAPRTIQARTGFPGTCAKCSRDPAVTPANRLTANAPIYREHFDVSRILETWKFPPARISPAVCLCHDHDHGTHPLPLSFGRPRSRTRYLSDTITGSRQGLERSTGYRVEEIINYRRKEEPGPLACGGGAG